MLVYWLVPTLIIAVLVILYVYAFRFEPSNFKLSQVDIFLRQLGERSKDRKGLPYLTILHLSDFHLRKNRKGKKLFKFVQGLADQEVDLIFITGDLVEQDKNIPYLVEMLKPLKARYGKFAVLGVHDYYDKKASEFIRNMFKRKRTYKRQNDIERLIAELGNIGVEVLQNKVVDIDNPYEDIRGIQVAGIDDPVILRKNIGAAFGKPSDAPLSGPEKNTYYQEKYREHFRLSDKDFHLLEEKAKLLLCLVHTPDSETLVDLAEQGADIIFSGHTHGGQVRLPLVGALLTGCKLNQKYASGLFYFKRFVLYVSRGLSEGRYSQFRFFCQPEASIVNIYKK